MPNQIMPSEAGTDLLSKLTLGTVQLGIPYGIHNRSGMPSEESSFELLQLAWEGGVTSYDTAAAYGESESLLGRFFHGKQSLVTTKIHLRPEPGATGTEIERAMRERVESSLERLQLSSVPILMLHNTDVMETFGGPITASFEALKRDGLIAKAGISVSQNTPDEYRSLWPYLQNDTYEAVQLPMNVLDHRPLRNGCVSMLAEAGKTVFVRSLFLQGLLYMKDEDLPPRLGAAQEPLAKLRALSEKYGVSLPQLAVSFIRDLDGVNSLVIGAETKDQVRDNIALVEGPSIPEAMREEIAVAFADVPEQVITPIMWK
ncbi:aldo/keto reductase [Paenibacillus ginsengarvi]|uniref:Aldo/keto reductase n=1 Tax=Paenibacillus ginsengarvi TaxID=400777 RepID=A0A3B0BDR7_9BACL|nr:aldo/keto reductase [Paenibacillus ginsengarvi]RKN70609.1 aldo/keto reductase [Paenibacillus ginsengarvi]